MDTDAWKEDDIKPQGEDSDLQAEEKVPQNKATPALPLIGDFYPLKL